MSNKQTFKVLLQKADHGEATGITVPFDVEAVYGARRVPVKVVVNGVEHKSTVVRMGGEYMMAVPKRFRDAAQIKAGETIEVAMERDTEKRTVEIPSDLGEALAKADLQSVWEKLSFTHRKEYVNAVIEAKKEETRTRRIEKTVETLISKRK